MRLYEIRRESLPAGTRAVAWRDEDRIVVAVQRGLGRLGARAAVARALHGIHEARKSDLALLPVLALLQPPGRRLLAAIAAGSGIIVGSVALILLLPSGVPHTAPPSPTSAPRPVALPHHSRRIRPRQATPARTLTASGSRDRDDQGSGDGSGKKHGGWGGGSGSGKQHGSQGGQSQEETVTVPDPAASAQRRYGGIASPGRLYGAWAPRRCNSTNKWPSA